MPGPCQRLRLPSLASVKWSSRANYTRSSSQSSKEERRVAVMGAARVGKSCIISQFLFDKFQTRHKATVEELHRADYDLPDGSALTLDILDTSGSFEFPAMRTLNISTADAFILVYAVDDAESWREVERLRNQILTTRGSQAPMVIVGNKTDVPKYERVVQYEVTEMVVCEEWHCGYIECSALENVGVLEIFKELLVQANIRYNLSPAVRRRRQSLPSFSSAKGSKSPSLKCMMKRHSCTMT